MIRDAGHIMEIFSAIQGEGPWVGVRQIFVRLYRCNLRCSWCDTPESFNLSGPGKVENPPGSRTYAEFENPISPARALDLLLPFLELPHHSVSFTGGEPLLQTEFLENVFPKLRAREAKIFLETGGSLPERLNPLIDFIDYVSMDIKLPSSAKERPLWKKHQEFLKISALKNVYVKIVLTEDTLQEELVYALDLIHQTHPNVPVILQPVTPIHGSCPPPENQVLKWHQMALEKLPDVRVIPQVHRLMGHK